MNDDDDPIWSPPPLPLKLVHDRGDLVIQPAPLPAPESIPPREWLYGNQLVRSYVTVLVAPGGAGKTVYAMGVGLALATGRPLLGEHVFQPVKVAVLNLEDPMDELNRRLAAQMIRHGIKRDEVLGRYYLYSGDDRPVTIAALSDDGFDIVHPDKDHIINEIQEHEISVLVVDPFAESHTLEENNNPQMIRASSAWRLIARVTGCAILLIHHVRKGAATDIDAARGAKALTDSARVGLLLSPMSEQEAEQLGIGAEERTAYVRLDDAKANMARKTGRARWFELAQINLGNGRPTYPHGDTVAAIAPWSPPSAFGELTVAECNAALDRIAAGLRPGVLYTQHRRQGRSDRWAGSVLIEMFDMSDARAASIISTWLNNNVLFEAEYHNAEQRRNRLGLHVNDAKRPGVECEK